MENIGKELIQLFKLHKSYLATQLATIELYPGQEGLLYHLSLDDGQTMSELTEKMNIQHATLFTMVERMAKNDLIRKDKDKLDKRTSRIYLTPISKKKLEKVSAIWLQTERQILKDFTEDEKKDLFKLIKKINNNLKN